MKIIIFDLQTEGHHVQFVNLLCRYFIDLGDEVTFITWKHCKYIQRLERINPELRIEFVLSSNSNRLRKTLFFRQYDYFRGYSYCLKWGKEQAADVAQFMYVDRSEIALLFSILLSPRSRTSLFGFLIAPYFLSKNYKNTKMPLFFKFYFWLNRIALRSLLQSRKVKQLFVLSHHTKEIMNNLWKSLPKAIIEAVPDPVEDFPNDCSKRDARKKLGLPTEGFIFLHFGTLTKEKGSDIFLESIPLVKENAFWLIAGKPVSLSRNDISDFKKKLDKPNRLITHLGFIPDELFKYYFKSCDIVVLPYRFNYIGTSGILQTATGASKPVIASRVGQIGEIVEKEKLGFVVSPNCPQKLAKKMEDIISKKLSPTEFEPSIRKYAQRHNWKQMAFKIRKGYVRTSGCH